jgi:hypothetical protein
MLEHFNVQLFLAAEIVIDHANVRRCPCGDCIDASAAESLGGELGDGFPKNSVASLLRMSESRRLPARRFLSGRFGCHWFLDQLTLERAG